VAGRHSTFMLNPQTFDRVQVQSATTGRLVFLPEFERVRSPARSNCLKTPSHSSEMDQQTFRAQPILISLAELANQMLHLLYASIGGEKAIIDGAQLNLYRRHGSLSSRCFDCLGNRSPASARSEMPSSWTPSPVTQLCCRGRSPRLHGPYKTALEAIAPPL
jgi:hypothetical protein